VGQALVALGLVLGYEGNQVHFYRADGVKPLIKLLGSPNPGIQLRVLEVLAVLANNGTNSRPANPRLVCRVHAFLLDSFMNGLLWR
jgi:hypothetical protein